MASIYVDNLNEIPALAKIAKELGVQITLCIFAKYCGGFRIAYSYEKYGDFTVSLV